MREAFLIGSDVEAPETAAPEVAVVPARTYNLTKVKLDKDGYVSAEYTQSENNVFSEHTTRRYQSAHPDLVRTFHRLAAHVCLLTDQVSEVLHNGDVVQFNDMLHLFEEESFYDAAEFAWAAVRCSGFTLNSGGVVLVAQKHLKSGRTLNLVTPFELLEPDPDKPTGLEYTYLAQLRQALRDAEEEVKLYLDGKHDATGEQLDLFDDVTNPDKGTNKLDAFVQGLAKEMGASAVSYTVSVGRPGGEMHELGKGRKTGKDAAAGADN